MRFRFSVPVALILCSGWLGLGVTAAPSIAPDVVVAADGRGDFRTIQAAVDSIPRDNRERRIILVRDGVYAEQVRIDAAAITLRGESRPGVRIEFSGPAEGARDRLRNAVLGLSARAHDFVLENLTVKNTHGVLGMHAFAILGLADRTVIQDCDLLSAGNDTLSLWRGRAQHAAEVAGQPPEDETLLKEGGRYYHARLRVEGSVDFICPRGWCYLVDSTITQVNPGATAAIWHDGSGDADKKFVLRGCRFDGPANWYLARRHHDGQFYLIDCTFSERMRDRAPYRVIYPLNGGTPSDADVKRNRELDEVNRFGDRNYFHNAHRVGGDYAWHRDNLATAPGAPRPTDVTARWTFAGTWDPERTDAPRVVTLKQVAGAIELTWSERVTVKGRPRLRLADGTSANYAAGSGTRTLRFVAESAAAATADWDFSAGVVVASEAGATLRVVGATLFSR